MAWKTILSVVDRRLIENLISINRKIEYTLTLKLNKYNQNSELLFLHKYDRVLQNVFIINILK